MSKERFKPIDELMNEYKDAAKNIPAPYQNSYILGMLKVAYKMLWLDYQARIKKK